MSNKIYRLGQGSNTPVYHVDIDPISKQVVGWATSNISDYCIRINIESGHHFFTNPTAYMWTHEGLTLNLKPVLEEAKASKERDLTRACEEAILGGFLYEVRGILYRFSSDREAQMNIQNSYEMFRIGFLETTRWSVRFEGENQRIDLDKDEMTGVFFSMEKHKQDCLTNLHDVLLPKLREAETLEDIESIVWDNIL